VVKTRCAFPGTDRGGVLWYPPTDKHAIFTGTFTDRFSDGRLVELRGGIDMTSLLEQLDLLPPDENRPG
jgi:predicted ester cyclase